MELTKYTATELAKLIKNKEVKIQDVLTAYLDNIEKTNDNINAFITVDREGALLRAKFLQEKIDAGEDVGPLAGVPVAIKDNICVAGIKTTCGSRILDEFVPAYSATATEKLERAGAIVIGKTNMDEFAMGSTTRTSYYGVCRNPVSTEYLPGGSSGGSAAAVAGNMGPLALGSDTGGSIRQPAAYCGLVGMKPTYGTVSRYGLVAYASSFDQIGPMGRNVEDCANLLQVIAGYDEKDATSVKRDDYDFVGGIGRDISGMKLAVPKEFMEGNLETDIKEAVMEAVGILKSKGATVTELSLKYTEYAVMVYYIIACAQASSNLARFDGVKYGYRSESYNDLQEMYENTWNAAFGEEVRKRIGLGEYVLSSGFYEEYYLKALKIRRLVKEEYDRLFKEYDAIISPVTKVSGMKIYEDIDNIKLYMDDIYTVPANLCGFPAISVPVKGKGSLPIGVQIMGNLFKERDIISLAYALEKSKEEENR